MLRYVAVWQLSFQEEMQRRADQCERAFVNFSNSYDITLPNNLSTPSYTTTVNNLTFWLKFCSWAYCDDCNLLHGQTMGSNLKQRYKPRVTKCVCRGQMYVVPKFSNVTDFLKSLPLQDAYILRPFVIDLGPYERRQHGYRIKTAALALSYS